MREIPKILRRVGPKNLFRIETDLEAISGLENLGIPKNFENPIYICSNFKLLSQNKFPSFRF